MKQILILFLPFVFCIFVNEVGAQTGTSQTLKHEIALITAITSGGKNFTIDADFVQMLTGKAAINEAKKNDEAEFEINAKGDSTWYVPNDFYILNSNTKTRKLAFADNIEIYLVKEGGSKIIKSSLQSLKKSYAGKLFKLTVKQMTVLKIVELYVP